MDFDHFKAINDTHGHGFGDRVLKESCATIRDSIRTPDLLGRYGGEEFVVVLVECPQDEAVKIAERIRYAVSSTMIQKRNTGAMVRVSASIGLYMVDAQTKDAQTALRKADRALYAAKKASRNRVVVYGPELGH